MPVALHFGWITAAALVNFNNWLARIGAPLRAKEAAAYASRDRTGVVYISLDAPPARARRWP